jgi:hypothetical protein
MPKVLGSLTAAETIDAGLGFRHGSSTAPSWTKGAGTPEGAITAPVGSIFSRTDGGTNTAVYRKEAGVGNTGWVAVAAAPADAVTSVDGRTGVVTLSDLYVDISGDTMTGPLAFSPNPATSGMLRLPNGSAGAINFRSADNTVNYGGLSIDPTNAILIAGPGLATKVLGSSLSIGTNPAAAQALRLPNNNWVAFRNAANTADARVMTVGTDDRIRFGGADVVGGTDIIGRPDIKFNIISTQVGQFTTSAFSLSAGVVAESPSGYRHGGSTAPSWTAGAGTPEGVVTAPVGSMFSRTDGAANTALYRKETGTGNTGWAAVAAAPADAVASVDGRTGVVTLTDKYVDTTGDSMSGALTVNADLSVNSKLNVGEQFSVNTATAHSSSFGNYAIRAQTAWATSVNSTSTVIGGLAIASATVPSGVTLTNAIYEAIYAWQGRAVVDGDGTFAIGSATGVIGVVNKSGTSTLPRSVAIVGAGPGLSAGVITTAVGVEARNQGRAGMANAFGIVVEPQTGATNNYGVAVGAAAQSTLWLGYNTNPTTAAGGIHFGSSRDIGIYRTGVGTLSISGSLTTTGGITPGGSLTMPEWDSILVAVPPVPTTFSATSEISFIGNAPFNRTWHDLVRFNTVGGVPVEATLSGSTWTNRALTTVLFDGTEIGPPTLADGTTITGVRWTWSALSSMQHGSAEWVRLAMGYVNPLPAVVVEVEYSDDGVAWTMLANVTEAAASQKDIWIRVPSLVSKPQMRVTVRSTNGGAIRIGAVQLYSRRVGDQGYGSFLEYPYSWNYSKQIGINTAVPGNGPLTIGTNANSTTQSGGIWFGTDTTLFRSAANSLSTNSIFTVNNNLVVGSAGYGFNANIAGRAAIGAPIAGDTMLVIGGTGLPNALSTAGIGYGIWSRPTNGLAGDVYGIWAQAVSSTTGGTVAQLFGANFGYRFANATGTLTAGRGINLESPTITAGGVVATSIALDVWPQKVTGVTTAYGVYQRGAADLNYFAGNTAVGPNAPTATHALYVVRNLVDADLAANRNNGNFVATLSPTVSQSTYSGNLAANLSLSVPAGVTLTDTDGSLYGLSASVTKTGDGNVANARSLMLGWMNFNGNGTMTSFSHIGVNNTRRGTGTGTITNVYGVNIVAQAAAHVTNAYGIYQSGAADLNYFAGNVGIGAVGVVDQSLKVQTAYASVANVFGVNGSPSNSGNGGVFGGHFRPSAGGATVASAIGALGGAIYTGTGTLTSAYALQAYTPSRTSSGTITTAIGLDIQDQKPAGVTTSYGIYQRGASDANVFAGALAAMTLSPSGVTGAAQFSRYTGATAGGAPTSGTYVQGDWVVDRVNGRVYICTVGGTPGTWVNAATGVAPNTGWLAVGYASDKTITASSTTLTEVANVLSTLIETLKTAGIIGA